MKMLFYSTPLHYAAFPHRWREGWQTQTLAVRDTTCTARFDEYLENFRFEAVILTKKIYNVKPRYIKRILSFSFWKQT